MEEFGVNRPNTVYTDPTTNELFELFQDPRAVYNVAEVDGEIVGGAGIYPTENLPPATCELVKMWLKPSARGIGLGRKLMDLCLQQAAELGFKNVYIESMPELKQAIALYEKTGFEFIPSQLGKSGHTGCALWMFKKL